jgi:S-adenosylmethionine:tRNA ribosyltransferase-isomerase
LNVANGGLTDRRVRNLPDLLQPGDLIISNDTQVIPARLHGKCGEAAVEVTLHRQIDLNTWSVFARPAKKLKEGKRFFISDGFYAEVLGRRDVEVILKFCVGGDDFFAKLSEYGTMPLPPYMKREATSDDNESYQTIFANKRGAVAAPTAGLHFTAELMNALKAKGVEHETVTLHVGAGTFLPVKVEDTKDHLMHKEYGVISAKVTDKVNQVKEAGGRVVAVGTTSLRLLESAVGDDGKLKPFAQETGIFITPGYHFRVVDVLMTNFHLPKSTLFMLVSAFSGLQVMQKAYKHATEEKYRFYSYGDACLLERGSD